jgi:hypothetical protein
MQTISPVEALQRLNEPVLVKMPIRRTKSCTCSSQSEELRGRTIAYFDEALNVFVVNVGVSTWVRYRRSR